MKYFINASNINGLGAVVLCRDIIQTMVSDRSLVTVFVSPALFNSLPVSLQKNKKIVIYKRFLPNLLSRFCELYFANLFFPKINTIILGDIPLNLNVKQNILVHNPIYSEKSLISIISLLDFFKKSFFNLFMYKASKNINKIFVQTNLMKNGLLSNLSKFDFHNRIFLINNPLCSKFLNQRISILKRRKLINSKNKKNKLILLYPSAYYPHKNHIFLKFLEHDTFLDLYVDKIILTIDKNLNPAPKSKLIQCIGVISYEQILELYKSVDYILFLSNKESLGLPLIEAQSIGIPIICPDLPYSREVCKFNSFFYDPNSLDSFKKIIQSAFNKNTSQKYSPKPIANTWKGFCNKLKNFN